MNRRGYTLIEVLLSIFIFGILATLFASNFESVHKKNQIASFTDQVYTAIKRAQTSASTGKTSRRCSNDLNVKCTIDNDCGAGNTCLAPILPKGWGIHITPGASPNPTTFQIYADQEDAECGNWVGSQQYLACFPHPNRRYDLYGSAIDNQFCNWAGAGLSSPGGPLTCLTDATQSDFLDVETGGFLSVPNGFVVQFKRADGITTAAGLDINFDITTSTMVAGSRTSPSNRDLTYKATPVGGCTKPNACYDGAATQVTVCVATSVSGPFNRILVYPSGLVVNAGGGFSTC